MAYTSGWGSLPVRLKINIYIYIYIYVVRKKSDETNENAEFVSTSFRYRLSSGEMMFAFSGEIKLQI